MPMPLVTLGYGIAADSGGQGCGGQGNEPDLRTSSNHVSPRKLFTLTGLPTSGILDPRSSEVDCRLNLPPSVLPCR